jgi:hypothetical protein
MDPWATGVKTVITPTHAHARFLVPCGRAFAIGLRLCWMGLVGAVLRRPGVDFEIGSDS